MKAKKALKRLNRVEAVLSDVLDQYAAVPRSVRDLLDSAKASIVRATETMNLAAASKKAKKPAAKAAKSKRHKAAKGPKKVSRATKKRVAAVKKKAAPQKAKKKAPAKKAAAKKPVAKKPVAKKPVAKKPVAKKRSIGKHELPPKAAQPDPVESATPTPEASSGGVHATHHSEHDSSTPSSEE